MSNREKIMRHLNIVGQLQPALHQPQHAPTGDLIDNAHFALIPALPTMSEAKLTFRLPGKKKKKKSGSTTPS